MYRIAFAALAILGAGNAAAQTLLIAETANGATYVAGSGDDCESAKVGAVYPDGWTRIYCQPESSK